jgi:methionyl-tRNA synthetase
VLFSPFLPFTSDKLHGFFGYESTLFGEQSIEEISDSLGTHKGLKYHGVERDGTPPHLWKQSDLIPGQKLNQPAPLFKKLDESVVEEERARLGK